MRVSLVFAYVLLACSTFLACMAWGQEQVLPIRWNPQLAESSQGNTLDLHKLAARKTASALTLPFFEDFSGYDQYPDTNKWTDFTVYINNTMAVRPVTRGVATFDDLNAHGLPYDSFSNIVTRFADSLTSKPIDISANTVADSLYFSFFYQPQGNGFYPLVNDSLILYFKNRFGEFIKVWAAPGTTLRPFTQVMIPVNDTLSYSDAFQFRFVNKAALYWADAVWNVDYIRMDKNRNQYDTLVNDVAFTADPSFLLNDYTSMPYAQFKVNPNLEIVNSIKDSIRNDSTAAVNINYGYVVKDGTFTLAGSAGFTSIFLNAGETAGASDAVSIAGYPSHPANTRVTYETTCYLESAGNTGPTVNDTAVRSQVFDNYLAYDDGTAEKSYYLNLFPSQPGKIAIEYHLNKPDTVRGMAIYFGRQIPFSASKPFLVRLYGALNGVNGAHADNLLYTSELLTPAYADSANHFWNYIFDVPQILPAGIFYAGTVQTEADGSDSLYYGLDVNRVGSNHAYFNVLGSWTPSLMTGAIMMRPIIGRAVPGSYVNNVPDGGTGWQIAPNPATDAITFMYDGDQAATYQVTDMLGHRVLQGSAGSGKTVSISSLPAGMYLVQLATAGVMGVPQKLIKL